MNALLSVRNLTVTDQRNQQVLLNRVGFTLPASRCLGIAGESGSGKSMTAKALLGLLHPWLSVTGEALLSGNGEAVDLLKQDETALRSLRGQRLCLILQDALSAFDPLDRIGPQMMETFCAHRRMNEEEAFLLAVRALKSVHLPEPEQVLRKYPHQLSGGMLQRCMIAIALALKPDIIIADEPTTALDSVNQKRVVEELDKLRRETGAALILISHDLGVVRHLSDQLLVLYQGSVAEYGEAADVFANPRHEYTRYLIGSRLEMSRNFQRIMKGRPVHA